MSSRLIIALALAGIVALGAGASWILIRPSILPHAEGNTPKRASDAALREHRKKFFTGDPERNIRGGQEMKPRW